MSTFRFQSSVVRNIKKGTKNTKSYTEVITWKVVRNIKNTEPKAHSSFGEEKYENMYSANGSLSNTKTFIGGKEIE